MQRAAQKQWHLGPTPGHKIHFSPRNTGIECKKNTHVQWKKRARRKSGLDRAPLLPPPPKQNHKKVLKNTRYLFNKREEGGEGRNRRSRRYTKEKKSFLCKKMGEKTCSDIPRQFSQWNPIIFAWDGQFLAEKNHCKLWLLRTYFSAPRWKKGTKLRICTCFFPHERKNKLD